MQVTLATENTILVVALASIAFAVILQLYYMTKIRKMPREVATPDDVLRAVVAELNRRLDRQDRKILDQQVRLDIVETRLERLDTIASEEGSISGRMLTIQQRVSTPSTLHKDVAARISQPLPSLDRLDSTARKVVELLRTGPKTPRQIQVHIDKSREHTARLMKRLFEGDFVDRDDSKRPFVYRVKHTG